MGVSMEGQGKAAGQRVLDLVRKILAETGPRLAGTPADHRGAELLAEAAKPLGDSVAVESFRVHPGAFLGFIKILVVLYLLALPLVVLFPWLAFTALTLGLLVLVFEFFLYKEVIDLFYPGREGRNVVAVLEPTGQAKRQVIVSGHHDSAHIFNFFIDRPELYGRRVNGGIGGFALFWLGSLVAALALPLIPRLVLGGVFLLGFAFVLPLWRFASAEGSPGAGDNLAASAIALEIFRHFREARDQGQGLTDTRLIFVSFDAEEAGLRGARAYAKAHRAELAALPTFAYNMDCIYEAQKLRFLLSDLNGSVKLDGPATQLLSSLAASRGLSATVAPIAFLTGGTDAAELAKVGVRTTSAMAMDWSNEARSSVYHTPKDLPEAVQPEAAEALFCLGVDFVLGVTKL